MGREETVGTYCYKTIILDHISARMAEGAVMTCDHISARMTCYSTMPSGHISAIMTNVMWHEERLWNVSVLQRVHRSNLVAPKYF
jgi:hypothetical protein